MIKKSLVALLALAVWSGSVLAAEHPISMIRGNGIDLKTYDHAIAGSVHDFLVWGFVDEATFSSELIMRRDGQLVRAVFKKEGEQVGGVIHQEIDGKARETSIFFVGINKEEQKLNLSINGEPVSVSIAHEGIKDGHFLNPTYTATIKGEQVSYRLEGDACYGFSFHLAALIIGAYIH